MRNRKDYLQNDSLQHTTQHSYKYRNEREEYCCKLYFQRCCILSNKTHAEFSLLCGHLHYSEVLVFCVFWTHSKRHLSELKIQQWKTQTAYCKTTDTTPIFRDVIPDSSAINCRSEKSNWSGGSRNNINHKLRQQFIGVSYCWMTIFVEGEHWETDRHVQK